MVKAASQMGFCLAETGNHLKAGLSPPSAPCHAGSSRGQNSISRVGSPVRSKVVMKVAVKIGIWQENIFKKGLCEKDCPGWPHLLPLLGFSIRNAFEENHSTLS